jgi:hypothetical protein
MDVVQKELPTVQEQPTGETPEQALARELRGAQAQIRDAGSVLRDALAEDDRLAALAGTPLTNTAQSSTGPGNVAQGDIAQGNNGQAEGGRR